ncbi:unnamed protein product [Miscanthus lutarioriparius]|uniref:Uncharacterized protein n=1 Tax=Miscanthus lutarioriparius TaxID=422564 RepID=A0A811Q321_9POAL|nr:unnamed protein product [Miscanthus lutarioriparius]
MSRPGDPADRPQDTATVAFSTDEMDRELNRLSMHGMVAWLGKDRLEVEPAVIKKAICHRFVIRPEDVTVIKHFPEDFFVDFTHRHQRDEALAATHARRHLQPQVPCLAVPGGHPTSGLEREHSQRAIARACDINYVEKSSLDRKDTRALCLWAWMHNLSDILKVTWLTLSCRKAEFHDGPPARGRRDLTFRVLVHLDFVEDPPGSNGRTPPCDYMWRYGVVDDGRVPRDRLDPPPTDVSSSRRDDDDDDRRGHHERRSDN